MAVWNRSRSSAPRTTGATTYERAEGGPKHAHHDEHADRWARESQTGHRDDDAARDKFGGVNIGAAFFGWIVAIGMAILLSSIVGAIAAAIGDNVNVTRTDAERDAGTIGIVAAAVLLAVLALAYFFGGYVAGRMSRYDGAKQGFAVWAIGFLVTIIAAVLGAVFGDQFNILDRVNLPNVPVSLEQASWGAIIAALAIVVGTLIAAVLGGKIGTRYHSRVDKYAGR